MVNTIMPSDDNNQNLQQDLTRIDEKRKVLEKIVEITRAIEQMQDSLNAVLILGMPFADLPPDTIKLFYSLSDSMQSQSTNKIKEYLENLEKVVNKQLEKILHFSGFDFESDESLEILTMSGDSAHSDVSPIEMLNDFKRTAQTAVSLRVLLKKRGVSTGGAMIAVSKEVIQQQYSRLEAQETQQREKVKEKVIDLQKDISEMIDNPDYPDSMKTMLTKVLGNLENDFIRIEAGAKLEQLSFIADTHELSEVPLVEEDTGEEQPRNHEKKKPSSLSNKASRWLNSSWDVSWRDLDE